MQRTAAGHLLAVGVEDLAVLPRGGAAGDQAHAPRRHALRQLLLDDLRHIWQASQLLKTPFLGPQQENSNRKVIPVTRGCSCSTPWSASAVLQGADCTADKVQGTGVDAEIRSSQRKGGRCACLAAQEGAVLAPPLADGPRQPGLHGRDVLVQVVACPSRRHVVTPDHISFHAS